MADEVWVVRADRGGIRAEEFVTEGHVAIGWVQLGQVQPGTPRSELIERMAAAFPDAKQGRVIAHASTIARFTDEIQIGDWVTVYDPEKRTYFIGKIRSGVTWRDGDDYCRIRSVAWEKKAGRDQLSVKTRNSLGAISTLFRIGELPSAELLEKSVPLDSNSVDVNQGKTSDARLDSAEEADQEEILQDVIARSDEFIEDRIARLDWEDMQRLVAGILRAMGYRTKVASSGPDRGVDIFASPDGLGLETPRIFVEVKHRPNSQMGAPEIRTFLGGRQPGDRCLYVSTGGFSREARYEAERSSVPLTLIALPELRELLVEHYEGLDGETTGLVPLTRVYWPAD